jgi:hypothetical protein
MKIATMVRLSLQRTAIASAAIAIGVMLPAPGRAQSPPPPSNPSLLSPMVEYFADWLSRVTRIQSEQPHWVTPLVTVTPRLEEEYRYDQLWQAQPHGKALDNFGANKGLELIPFQNTEIILGTPGWIAHNGALPPKPKKGKKPGPKPASDGWADETFLIKYRILSADEENGDYILTAFMGFSVPTGDDGNSAGHTIYTPTIAFGKGFGDFDFQNTVGIAIPNGGVDRLSMPLSWNTAFQYRILRYFWPELEFNYTWFTLGENTGKSQLFITPGLLIGRIPIHDRVGMTFGAGYQVAVTHHPAYNNAVIASGRIPF